MDEEFHIVSTMVEAVSETESVVEMTIADNADPDEARDLVTITITVTHREVPLLAELQAGALERARGILQEQAARKREQAGIVRH